LLTGANHHAVGMGTVASWDTGFPGYRGRLPRDVPTLATILAANGYNTFAIGKWHLTPPDATTSLGPYSEWPIGRGFDRFYGFLGGWTSQFSPELWYDNHRVDAPSDQDYHLSTDLVDHSIDFVRDHVSASTTKPFCLYLAFGACHAPFHVPEPYVEKYRGRFDEGWDRYREEVLERQKGDGLVPADTILPPENPGVRCWNDLSNAERAVAARWQEVFAGFLDHTDREIGRLVQFLRQVDRFSNTVFFVLSDNGASSEGGSMGLVNYLSIVSRRKEELDRAVEMLDHLGGPETLGLYPAGWAQAGNTPLRYYKGHTYGGGVRTPLVIRWDAGLAQRGTICHDFRYVTDVVPTVLEATGVDLTDPVVPRFLHGESMLPALRGDRDRPHRKPQYFEMFGHRGIWADGWKAVTVHARNDSFENDEWLLYDLANDFAERINLAREEPARLRAMVQRWWAEAGANNVLPLDDRRSERSLQASPSAVREQRRWVLYPEAAPIPDDTSPNTIDRSYCIVADITRTTPDQGGVLVSRGNGFGGFSFYIKDNRLFFVENVAGIRTAVSSDDVLPLGSCKVAIRFERDGAFRGSATLEVDGSRVGSSRFESTMPSLMATFGGLRCNRDAEVPVSDEYLGPNPFSGDLERVTITLEERTP
jgi:arylsulfatase